MLDLCVNLCKLTIQIYLYKVNLYMKIIFPAKWSKSCNLLCHITHNKVISHSNYQKTHGRRNK